MKKIVFFLFFFCIALYSISQVPFELNYQHNGRYDFTMIGATFNNQPNNDFTGTDCNDLNLNPGETASDDLQLDTDQSVIAAYLYWSSNFSLGDREVTLNGELIESDKGFTDTFGAFSFSGAVADVTTEVQTQGNTTYTVDDLALDRTANNGCSTSYGGWVMIVVYEDLDLPLNSVNIYDGFLGITTNNGRPPITINITDLLIANDIGSFLGIVAWEGDGSLGGPTFDEVVEFNGNALSNSLNPNDNLFNETNTFGNETDFYNMDMDRFSIDDFVDVGDQQANIRVESEQDLVIMNVIAFTLGNELPEPTIDILSAESDCVDNEIAITFDVRNFNANNVLPVGTEIDIFIDVIDSTPELELATTTEIPIGGTESFSITVPYPSGDPTMATIFAQVNLDTDGEPIILELNSDNNVDEQVVDIAQPPQIPITALEECDNGTGNSEFDLDALMSDFIAANPTITISIHATQTDADNNNAPLTGVFTSSSNPQNLYARQVNTDTGCIGVVEFQLIVNDNPQTQNAELRACSSDGSASFTLANADGLVTTETGVGVQYYAALAEAEDGTGTALPNNFTTSQTTVFARVEFSATGCFSTAEVDLLVFDNPENNAITNVFLCEADGNESEQYDLTLKLPEILGSQNAADLEITFHTSQADANNDTGEITDPENFVNTTNPQTIFVRVENNANDVCFTVLSFTIEVNQSPPANDVPISVANCSSTPDAVFDLTAVALEVANNDSTMDVEFYETAADAEAGMNIITNPMAYSSPTGIVFGKVIDPSTTCFSLGEISLTVVSNPLQSNQVLMACADNQDNDMAFFDLTQFEDQLIGTQQNVTISYHTSFADADSATDGGDNPIVNPTNFAAATSIIYIRSQADFQSTICQTVSEIEVTVNPRPFILPVIYSLCSDSDEAQFNLASQVANIIGGQSDISIEFYNTQTGATNQSSADEITGTVSSPNATVFVRATNSVTGCVEIGSISLEVVRNPEIPENIVRTECVSGGTATFDLEEIRSTYQAQFANFDFTFHASDADATADQNPLGSSINLNESTDIFMRFDLNGTDCFSVKPVMLEVPEVPVDDRGQFIICLSNGFTLPDGTTVFDPDRYEILINDPATGCDVLTITELIVGSVEFPTAFAPNGNGANDRFGGIPGEECVGEVTDYELVVWNRWGEKVFETNSFVEGWDGRFNGKLLDGIYLWHATYTFQGEPFEKSGSVALIF